MANNRRGGPGNHDDRYGDGAYDADYDDDEQVEATRAMEVLDDLAPPTEMVRPPPPAARPQRPRPQPRRPEPIYEEEDDESTRMIDAMDMGAGAPTMAPPQPAEPLIELRIVSGPDRGKSHQVSSGDHMVGRGLDCGIVLADPAVSRKHFRLYRSDDVVEAIDMGGANGTNINGNRISRHRLQQGDQIEVGTTVLQLHIEGAVAQRGSPAASRFMQEVEASGSAAVRPPAQKNNLVLFLGLAVVGFVVLLGGGLAAYFVLGGDGDKAEVVKGEGDEGDELAGLVKKAKELIDDREWAEAVDKLKAARKINRDDTEAKGLLAKAEEEMDSSEAIEDGKASVRTKDYESAFQRFKEVPQTSEQYAEAQDELAAAREEFFAEQIKTAKAALDEGETKKAQAALDKVLAIDPDNAEAKAMRASVEAGGADEVAPDKGDDKGDKPTRQAAGGGSTTGQSSKSLFNTALKAYHERQWSAAQQSLGNVSDGNFSSADKKKAREYAASVQMVASAMGVAETAGSPIKKARAFQKAYNADRKVDGHFGPVLVGRLTEAYVAAGKGAFSSRRYAKAAEAAREAMNYDPVHQGAMDLEEKCIAQAATMLEQARDHLKKRNYATARDLARQVTQILPALDPRAGEAREIAKKATEASVSGDDED